MDIKEYLESLNQLESGLSSKIQSAYGAYEKSISEAYEVLELTLSEAQESAEKGREEIRSSYAESLRV